MMGSEKTNIDDNVHQVIKESTNVLNLHNEMANDFNGPNTVIPDSDDDGSNSESGVFSLNSYSNQNHGNLLS